ncbi:MAG: serine/threonine protein kinase [Acidobacteria bacterium]|nr:MAG: serine/threonine protein kinase [Acidobacteriota bacterium]
MTRSSSPSGLEPWEKCTLPGIPGLAGWPPSRRFPPSSPPTRVRRFEQEARAASSLNHPNIVHIYDVGTHEGVHFIAMEYVEGQTLREILESGALVPERLLSYARQLAEGLAKAHGAKVVHRDLKPENVMVTTDGYVKILDFGLAKLYADVVDGQTEAPTLERAGTTPGTVLGTAGYMSPEQARGLTADYRADQFAFGAILYEMAQGGGPRPDHRPARARSGWLSPLVGAFRSGARRRFCHSRRDCFGYRRQAPRRSRRERERLSRQTRHGQSRSPRRLPARTS